MNVTTIPDERISPAALPQAATRRGRRVAWPVLVALSILALVGAFLAVGLAARTHGPDATTARICDLNQQITADVMRHGDAISQIETAAIQASGGTINDSVRFNAVLLAEQYQLALHVQGGGADQIRAISLLSGWQVNLQGACNRAGWKDSR